MKAQRDTRVAVAEWEWARHGRLFVRDATNFGRSGLWKSTCANKCRARAPCRVVGTILTSYIRLRVVTLTSQSRTFILYMQSISLFLCTYSAYNPPKPAPRNRVYKFKQDYETGIKLQGVTAHSIRQG